MSRSNPLHGADPNVLQFIRMDIDLWWLATQSYYEILASILSQA
jgi:hypothetical protein